VLTCACPSQTIWSAADRARHHVILIPLAQVTVGRGSRRPVRQSASRATMRAHDQHGQAATDQPTVGWGHPAA
jgi:hypothetical protein